jgi:hypothetical protein
VTLDEFHLPLGRLEQTYRRAGSRTGVTGAAGPPQVSFQTLRLRAIFFRTVAQMGRVRKESR